jgi:hypothetical protein
MRVARFMSRLPWHTRTKVSLLVTMLLTAETTDDGERRVYYTRYHSIVSFFAEDGEGGISAHAHPGWLAHPLPTDEQLASIRLSMLSEAARRLGCRVDQVQLHTLDDIAKVSDPLPKYRLHWAGRTRIKGRGGANPFPRR